MPSPIKGKLYQVKCMCSVCMAMSVSLSICNCTCVVFLFGVQFVGLNNLFITQKPPSVGALCLIKGPGADLGLAAKANIGDTMQRAGSSFINKTCHKALCVCMCVCVSHSSARQNSHESVT